MKNFVKVVNFIRFSSLIIFGMEKEKFKILFFVVYPTESLIPVPLWETFMKTLLFSFGKLEIIWACFFYS